jgi:hypothetical protein
MPHRGGVAGSEQLVYLHAGQTRWQLVVEIARHRKHPIVLLREAANSLTWQTRQVTKWAARGIAGNLRA